jgi:hypothetical protein
VDGSQFDAWTRRVTIGVHGRRAALKTGLAAVAAGLLGHGASDQAAAAPRCPNTTGCDELCRNTNKECACIRQRNGDRVCVHPCCSNRTCKNSGECRPTEVCMQTSCCGERSFCVTKCTQAVPNYCNRMASAAEETPGAPWGTTTSE